MPTISKKTKVKKVVTKKKTTPTKVKTTPTKKKVVKKVKKPTPKKANQIVVDIISDDESVNNNLPGYQLPIKDEESNNVSPIFSSWSDFNKKTEPDDMLSELDENDNDSDSESLATEEYDKQKKFFSDWAMQNAPKEGEEKPITAPKKSVGLYRRQAIFYLGATLILLLAVAYFFFVKLTIYITPQGEKIDDSVSFSLVSNDATSTSTSTDALQTNNKIVSGELKVEEVVAEKTFQTTGEDVSSGEAASLVTGTVTLINKYNKNQALVATTRLLSPDGKLFRLKNAVNIPAGGTITASVYADKPGIDMIISSPTKFIIPGLWAGIQDRIYAESLGSFNYETQTKKIIKQSDLDNAKKDIAEVIDLKIKNELQNTDGDQVAVFGNTSDDMLTDFNVKIGDEKDEFTVKAVRKVVIATFSKEKVIDLAKARLSLIVSDDKQLSGFNANQMSYTLENFDETAKIAEIKARFTGVMSLKSDSSLIDPKKMVGLNEDQISKYLNTFQEVKDYKLEFWPPFIKNAPNLPDRINIKIAD